MGYHSVSKTNTRAKIVNTVITLIVVLSALLIAEFVTDLGGTAINLYRSSDASSERDLIPTRGHIGIGMHHQSATKRNKETWTVGRIARSRGFMQLVVPVNHFLLSTQRNKPTTASQPQQPWNILTWIFTETQVATAKCLPPQALF
ncbi:hypothetical protein PROFUN_07678 [Planoprotostelium fungivorum]|uniref:Uncharacterized protein n=1 Tax=Planoprotostelium fungivorum TaxID=1890364 RepID=A0A2P6MM45_9EUKA|nr:hypothetical protein PROFUN_07678 [Planoprotostelium fungivorum]